MSCAKFFPFEDLTPFMPKYQTPGSSGVDLAACLKEPLVIPTNEYRVVGTGLRVEINDGFEGQVRSRSGLAAKYGVFVLNSPGTVDSSYEGHVQVILFNSGHTPFVIKNGDRIAQMVFAPIALAECEVIEGVRGIGGFGSTGV